MKTTDIVVGRQYAVKDRALSHFDYTSDSTWQGSMRYTVLATGQRTRPYRARELARAATVTVNGVTHKVPADAFVERRYEAYGSSNGVLVAQKNGRTWSYRVVPPKDVRVLWSEFEADVAERKAEKAASEKAARSRVKYALAEVKAAFGVEPGDDFDDDEVGDRALPTVLQPYRLQWLTEGSTSDLDKIEDLLWAYDKGRTASA